MLASALDYSAFVPSGVQKLLWMGRFGGLSPKPTHLVSNAPWIGELDGCKPPVGDRQTKSLTTTRYVDREGRRRCTGTKFLKGTQPGALCVLPARALHYPALATPKYQTDLRLHYCSSTEVVPQGLRESVGPARRPALGPRRAAGQNLHRGPLADNRVATIHGSRR